MKTIFILLFSSLISLNGFSQQALYKCCIKNIKQVDPNTIEFDVYFEGEASYKLASFQGGITFNDGAIANGGNITGEFKKGSADKALPNQQQSPKWTLNPTSKQIRMTAAIAPDSVAISIPGKSAVKLGTFVLKNSVPFNNDIRPEFNWSFARGSGTTTTTQVTAYLNGVPSPKNITNAEYHCIEN